MPTSSLRARQVTASVAPTPRRRGTILLWIATVLLALSAGPLLLYCVFGPADGNPIGLGLLFFFGAPPSLLMLAIALGLRASDRR
jgi:hypothetical protein